jgi:hypothetical protein
MTDRSQLATRDPSKQPDVQAEARVMTRSRGEVRTVSVTRHGPRKAREEGEVGRPVTGRPGGVTDSGSSGGSQN